MRKTKPPRNSAPLYDEVGKLIGYYQLDDFFVTTANGELSLPYRFTERADKQTNNKAHEARVQAALRQNLIHEAHAEAVRSPQLSKRPMNRRQRRALGGRN